MEKSKTSINKFRTIGLKVDIETFNAINKYCAVNSITKQQLLFRVCKHTFEEIRRLTNSKGVQND